MRVVIWGLIAFLAVGQQEDKTKPQPKQQPEKTTQSRRLKQTDQASSARPSAPVYSRIPPKYHGHPAERDPGTPPCGTRGSNCLPEKNPPQRDDHTGHNVAIGVGVGVLGGVLIETLAHASGPVNKLNNNGPQFPGTVHMSSFQVTGFVKGGWPLVIDYESIAPTYAVLTIVAEDAPPYAVLLPTDQTARRNVIIQLPLSLGTGLKIAEFTVRATVSDRDPSLRYFRVYGFGCGRKAVGSVGIDQVKFSPANHYYRPE